jgi:hypothetical protein
MSVGTRDASRKIGTRSPGAAWSPTAETPFAGFPSVESGIRRDVERKSTHHHRERRTGPTDETGIPRPVPLFSESLFSLLKRES